VVDWKRIYCEVDCRCCAGGNENDLVIGGIALFLVWRGVDLMEGSEQVDGRRDVENWRKGEVVRWEKGVECCSSILENNGCLTRLDAMRNGSGQSYFTVLFHLRGLSPMDSPF